MIECIERVSRLACVDGENTVIECVDSVYGGSTTKGVLTVYERGQRCMERVQ